MPLHPGKCNRAKMVKLRTTGPGKSLTVHCDRNKGHKGQHSAMVAGIRRIQWGTK